MTRLHSLIVPCFGVKEKRENGDIQGYGYPSHTNAVIRVLRDPMNRIRLCVGSGVAGEEMSGAVTTALTLNAARALAVQLLISANYKAGEDQ